MPMSPIDVQQKTFRVALRGYAEDEVDEFLDEIVLSIREYEQRIEELSFQVGSLEAQLVENRQTEEAMRRTLLLAERTADEITEEARREAERILSEARAEAKLLSAEQSRERDSLVQELYRLREIVTDVRERLTDVAGQTLDRLRPVAGDINETLDQVEVADASLASPNTVADREATTPAWAGAPLDRDDLDGGPALVESDTPDGSLDEGSAWAADDELGDADEENLDYWTSSTPRRSRWNEDDAAGQDAESPGSGDSADQRIDAPGASATAVEDTAGDFVDGAEVGGDRDRWDEDAVRSDHDRADEADTADEDAADEDASLDDASLDDASLDDASLDDASREDGPESRPRRRPWERFGD